VYEYVAFGPRSFFSVLVHLLVHVNLRMLFLPRSSPPPNVGALAETAAAARDSEECLVGIFTVFEVADRPSFSTD
jgi:hypothetical protein